MAPTLGRIVLFTLPSDLPDVNGQRTFPAIVTAVHSDTMVNLRVFLDADPANVIGEWKTSVARADGPGVPFTWCWPPRSDEGRDVPPAA